MSTSRVTAYVDGFNVYRGLKRLARRGESTASWKWYDPAALTRRIVPDASHVSVKYFTARLVTTAGAGEGRRERQAVYLRALRAQPDTTVHLGQYKERKSRRPLVRTPDSQGVKLLEQAGQRPRRIESGHVTVDVWQMEEKGSDVNLATHLVADAFRGEFVHAVVFSNDTDLCGPIRLVVEELGLPVTIVNPDGKQTAGELFKVASDPRQLRMKVVSQCQLPPRLHDATGKIDRPARW